MQNNGHLFVHDSDPKRLHPMAARVKRAGVSIVRQMAGNETRLSQRCQLVVSDVPCSGSGRWRRAPETKWHLTRKALMNWSPYKRKFSPKCRFRRTGRSSGYITCSIIARENENKFRILNTHREFVIDEAAKFGNHGVIRLDPHNTDTDGMFCAIMRRTGP